MKKQICQCQTTPDEHGNITAITLEIPAELLGQLEEAASVAGTDPQSLLICYARQGLIDSGSQLKRGKFMEHVREVLAKHGVQPNAIEEAFSKFPY